MVCMQSIKLCSCVVCHFKHISQSVKETKVFRPHSIVSTQPERESYINHAIFISYQKHRTAYPIYLTPSLDARCYMLTGHGNAMDTEKKSLLENKDPGQSQLVVALERK